MNFRQADSSTSLKAYRDVRQDSNLRHPAWGAESRKSVILTDAGVYGGVPCLEPADQVRTPASQALAGERRRSNLGGAASKT